MRPNPLMPILSMFDPPYAWVTAKSRWPKGQADCIFGQAAHNGRVHRSTKRVWFLVLPRTGVLNIAGPWEVLGHANDVLGRAAYQLELLGPSAPAAETRH